MKRCSCLCTNEKKKFIWTAWCDSIIERRLFWQYILSAYLIFELKKKAEKCETEKYSLINFSFMPLFFSPTQPTQRWEFIIKNNLFVDFPLLHFPHRLLSFLFFTAMYTLADSNLYFITRRAQKNETKEGKKSLWNESEQKKFIKKINFIWGLYLKKNVLHPTSLEVSPS